MTLNDLMEQATIQGGVIVRRFEDDGETEIVILNTPDFEVDKYRLNENDLEREIVYMFAVCSDIAYLVIEVE